MDVSLAAGLVPSQAATPARPAGAQPAAESAAGFVTALARALGVPVPMAPLETTSIDLPAESTEQSVGLRQLIAAALGGATLQESTKQPEPQSTAEAATHTTMSVATPAARATAMSEMARRMEPTQDAARAAPVVRSPEPVVAADPVRPRPVARAAEAGGTVEPMGTEAIVRESAVSDRPSRHPEGEAATVRATPMTNAAAPGPATTPTPAPARSLESLAPEFRTRLERVVTRMRDELGLQVRVVETFRTQERQDALYQQGRTVDGPKVTWTRSSNHTLGLAADVRVEGEAAAKAYAQLARIAAEEGLRTLGPNDPGHIEMPDGKPLMKGAERPAERPLPLNGIARVARVATVAQPAQVARVVQIATPGSHTPAAATPTLPESGAPRAAEAPGAAAVREIRIAVPQSPEEAARATTTPRAFATTSSEERTDRDARVTPPIDAATVSQGEPLMAAPAAERAPADARAANGGAPMQGTDIAARVARLMALQDASAQVPTTGMTLMLDGENGAEARIRLGVRGSAVGATIDIADPAEALQLGNRIGELRRALERQGLEPTHVAVRDVPGLKEIGEKLATVAPLAAAHATGETSAGSRSGDTGQDRPSGQPHRRDPGTADDRPRRNPREERK